MIIDIHFFGECSILHLFSIQKAIIEMYHIGIQYNIDLIMSHIVLYPYNVYLRKSHVPIVEKIKFKSFPILLLDNGI